MRDELISSAKKELLSTFQSLRESLVPPTTPLASTSQSSQDSVSVPELILGTVDAGPGEGGSQVPDSEDSEESEGESVGHPSKFKLSLEEVDGLIRAIHLTLGLSEEKRDLTLHDRMYAGLGESKGRVIPVHSVISETIVREWQDPEKKPFFPKAHKRRFPFEEDQTAVWNKVPKLDAAFSQVSRSTDLAFEDMGVLRDPMDKRMDLLLKRSWQSIMNGLKPAMATTCVARNLEFWTNQLKNHISADSSKEEILESFSTLTAAVAYIADASVEAIKMSARSAALANSARRALWLKTWPGDAASKNKLCGIPFSGDLLFGPDLDSILDRTADRKKSFPVKRKRQPPRRFFRQQRAQDKGNKPQGDRRGWVQKAKEKKGILSNPPAQSQKSQ